MGIKVQQSLQQTSAQLRKTFVAKEGTTLEDVKKHGTKAQVEAFFYLDRDHNFKFDDWEAEHFNTFNYVLKDGSLFANKKKNVVDRDLFVKSYTVSKEKLDKEHNIHDMAKKYDLSKIQCIDNIEEENIN